MRSRVKALLVAEAILLGVPISLYTLFFLPWIMVYAGAIFVASVANPIEGILMVWASLFFLSGPLAIIAYWWLAWIVVGESCPPSRLAHSIACLTVISACCLFFLTFGGFPRTIRSLDWIHAVVVAPLVGWVHFSIIVHRKHQPPPLPNSFSGEPQESTSP